MEKQDGQTSHATIVSLYASAKLFIIVESNRLRFSSLGIVAKQISIIYFTTIPYI